ncbi:MAG: GNAT family N-acetyltransferase [Gemmatimonadota bacterium]|nr:GNAT family N-acetyltransferase [Gemmatimonadota bacterium]
MVEIIHHADASELIALAGACLEAHESENNLLIGLAYALAKDPLCYGSEPPLLLSVLEQGSAIGAAVMTPPRRIILSKFVAHSKEAIAHLIRHLLATDASIPGVVGPASEAQAFSACWAEAVPSAAPKKTMRMRVFEARTVADVPLAAGVLRLASMDDHPLMAHWVDAFSQEALGEPADRDKAKKSAERFIADKQLYIWDCNGPVSIAKTTRPMRNGISVTAVYTPPEQRNKGYATSCVASLTKKLLSEHYSFCSLFADQSNPTSNSIYMKIGYVPMGDALEIDFAT